MPFDAFAMKPTLSRRTRTLVQAAFAGLAVTAFSAARAETEETVDHVFQASKGGTLILDTDFGAVEVVGGDSNEVSVHITRKVTRRRKSDEEEFLKNHPVTFAQNGNTVTVQSKSTEQHRSWWTGGSRTEGKYTLRVPARFDLNLTTAGGGIVVRQVEGAAKAHTSGGGLHFERLRGELNAGTSGGGVQLKDCDGRLRVQTSGGGIEVTGGKGELNGETSGGGVTVRDFAGPAEVSTSGGGITVERAVGTLVASTSGGPIQASLVGAVTGEIRLETSGGGVRLALPAGDAFDLDAATSGGGVSSDFAVTVSGKPEHGTLHGPVNGGGKPVVLRSSGGSIHVEKL